MGSQKEKRKKRKKFEETALIHIDSLYRTALFMTKNEQEAKDLIQETFFKAYRFFDKFEPGTNLKAWLFKILQNNYINIYRKKSKESFLVEFNELDIFHPSLVQEEADPEESLFRKLSSEHIKQAIEDLPEDWRLPLILADIEGFSYEEIAEVMKSPVGTVMSRLYRGRNLLRKKLFNYFKETKSQKK